MREWLIRFPYDKWWRIKYNVPLFSDEHLRCNPIDQKLEYIEDLLLSIERKKSEKLSKYNKNGEWIKSRSSEENDLELLKNFDWSTYKD